MYKLINNNLMKSLTKLKPNNLSVLSSQKYSNDAPRVEKTLNQVTLLGRVGVEPQQRGNEAHPVVTFSLATHNNYKFDSGEWVQRADWHQIAVFKPQLRESVKNFLTKGQRVLVNGKISYSELTNAAGEKKLATTIVADEIVFFRE